MRGRFTAVLVMAVSMMVASGCSPAAETRSTTATTQPSTTTEEPASTTTPTATTTAPTGATTTSQASTTTDSTVQGTGLAWTRVSLDQALFGGPGTQAILSLVAGGPGLVAAGIDGSGLDLSAAALWVSADGYNWSHIADQPAFRERGTQGIKSVAAGGPGLVAVGWDRSDGDPDAAVWVSADGYTWTRIDDEAVFGGPGNQGIGSVAAGGPGLVAVGSDHSGGDNDAAVWVSADGYTWTRIDDEAVFGGPGDQGMISVAAVGPGLVAAGSDQPGDDSDAAVWVATPATP
jgi:hypothetical protein